MTWLQAIPADAPIEHIRAVYERDGVVHVRGVLDRDKVFDTRAKFFEYVSPSGVLKPETAPREGLYNTQLDPAQFPGPSATQFNRNQNDNKLLDLSVSAGYEPFIVDFSDDPALLGFVGRLMSDWQEPFRFKRQLLRTNIPRTYKAATRVHYDQMWVRHLLIG